MSMTPHIRVGLSVLGYLAIGSCSSASHDVTGPPGAPPVVTLTVSADTVRAAGDINLTAVATGGNGVAVRKVEFYEKVIGVDASAKQIGEDSEAPYEIKRPISSVADNGTREFSARVYDADGQTGMSEPVVVMIAVGLPPGEPPRLQATVMSSHPRITTAGRITFTVYTGTKPAVRAELYRGATKVADYAGPLFSSWIVDASVTAADNGTQTYLAKVYDEAGTVSESAPVSVVVDIRWDFVRKVEGIQPDGTPVIATDATNAVYVASTSDGHTAFLAKHDADGNQVWIRKFGGGNYEEVWSVGVDPSGRVYMTGDIFAPPPSLRSDCFLALYDAAGTPVRTWTVDIPGWEKTSCVASTDAAGNFYVAGNVADSLARTTDSFLVKYDRDGNTLWTRQFGSAPGEWNDDILTSIAVDPLGGVYVAGYTNGSFDGSPPRAPRDVFVLKFDADGNRIWSKQHGYAGYVTFASHIAADPNGGVYVSGAVDDAINRFHPRSVVLSYGRDGAMRWERVFGGGIYDYGRGIAVDQRGVFVVGETQGAPAFDGAPTGEIKEQAQGGIDAFLAKISSDGELLSVRLLGTPQSDWASDIAIGANHNLYIAGAFSGSNMMLARHRDTTP